MEITSYMFIVIFIINIVLCIKTVPALGVPVGFLTVVLTGAVFMQDTVTIPVFFSWVLIVFGFITIIINGLDFKETKKLRK